MSRPSVFPERSAWAYIAARLLITASGTGQDSRRCPGSLLDAAGRSLSTSEQMGRLPGERGVLHALAGNERFRTRGISPVAPHQSASDHS
jgi:hypothetical protein